jgi:microcin C transport system permease protein
VIPTLLGITIINFVLVQFVPSSPIEEIIAVLEGHGDVFENIARGGGEEAGGAQRPRTSTMPTRGACCPPHRRAQLLPGFNFADSIRS